MPLTGKRGGKEFELSREVLMNKKNVHGSKKNRDSDLLDLCAFTQASSLVSPKNRHVDFFQTDFDISDLGRSAVCR